jgi:tetratricopeptide (TPR) repeat protein
MTLFIVALLFTGSVAVSAQIFIVTGKVELKQADGSVAPLPDAMVDSFRTDIKVKGPTAKTNKKGEFSIAGLTFGGTYILAASAAGAAPQTISDVKGSGKTEFTFTLDAGDGKRLTQDEALELLKNGQAISSNGGEVKETPEQKKAREDYEKQKKEIEEKNARVQNADKLIRQSLAEGFEAYKAGNYDLAITKYDEGLKADPDYLESVPLLMNNKSEALRRRGFDKHKASVSAGGDAAMKKSAKDDVQAAYDTAKGSLEFLKKATPPTDSKELAGYQKNKYNALLNMAAALFVLSMNDLDTTKEAEIKSTYPELLAMETDAVKKEGMQREYGDVLRKSNACEAAVVEYQKVLDVKPDDPDALAGAGLCIVNIGFMTDNKDKLQEGLNVLQHFVDVAPDTHKYKTDAKNTIEYLRTEQKLAPQKTPKAPVRKKP